MFPIKCFPFIICLTSKDQTLPFPSSLSRQTILMLEWKEHVTGVVHHFPSKEGCVQDALLSSINHTLTVAAMFSLMREREINCWQIIRTDGLSFVTCQPACTANCHGIIYLCYQHPELSKNLVQKRDFGQVNFFRML